MCLDVDLEVCTLFWLKLAKVKKLTVWKVDRFRGLTSLILGPDCDSRSWCRSVVSFGTCMQSLKYNAIIHQNNGV